jgi:hypothetical protein
MFENWTKPMDCESATCVEVCRNGGVIGMRTTDFPDQGLVATPEEFAAFIAAAKAGFYDGLLP